MTATRTEERSDVPDGADAVASDRDADVADDRDADVADGVRPPAPRATPADHAGFPVRRWIAAATVVAALFAVLVAVAAAAGLNGAGWDADQIDADGLSSLTDPDVYPLSETAALPTLPERAPTVAKVATSEPVVFITIDDGWTLEQRVIDLLTQRQAPVTVFPLGTLVEPNAPQWLALANLGGTIENHAWTHPFLGRLGADAQRDEICRQSDAVQRLTGRRPTMMRPPFGSTNKSTASVVPKCGAYSVVKWSMEVRNRKIFYDRGPARPEPGDIILLHFRPETYDELAILFAELDKYGLRAAPLQNYLNPGVHSAPKAAAPG